MKHIDPHVHCRDGKEAYKADIRQVSELARDQGIVAILDIPPVFSEKDVVERLVLAKERKPIISYFLYVGIISNKEQISEAVNIVRNYPQVVGLKMLSTDYISFPGVSREKDQLVVYQTLAKLGYQGVLMVHCEKQSKFKPKLWKPQEPQTHCLVRPPEAEIASVKDQIRFAKKAGFGGKLHITHISCPKSVELVVGAKKDLRVTCGVTPHHILWSLERMKGLTGLFKKANPPLRSGETLNNLRECLVGGNIDWIESDYAPHTLTEKLNPPYHSGIACYPLYQELLRFLSKRGVTKKQIENLTYLNIKKAFGQKLAEV